MPCFLTDFGLARDTATGSRYTRTGTALGTPAYMSPEQACGEGTRTARGEVSALTPATDVWALGCVLYEVLAGRRAFEADTDAAVVGQVLLVDPPRLRSLRSDAPAAVEHVVRVALAKRVGERYPNAATLRVELERVLRGEAPRARVPGRGRRLAMGVGAAVAIAAVAGAFAWPWLAAGGPPAAASSAQSEADALAARARDLQASDPRSAEDLLRQALDLEPQRDDLRLQHGLLLWAIGRGPEARDEWTRLRPDSPGARTGRLYRGLEAAFRLVAEASTDEDLRAAAGGGGHVGRLAAAALAAIERRWDAGRQQLLGDPTWEGALLRAYIETCDPRGDKATAAVEYTRALDSGIRFAWVLTNRAYAKAAIGDLHGALADCDAALAVEPRSALGLSVRGAVKEALGDLRGALVDHDAALRIDPRHAGALNNRATVKRDLGDLRGALADYDAALAIDPRDALVLSNRGAGKQALGDLRGALADYDAALAIDPRFVDALHNRGNAKVDLGDMAGALSDYTAALALDSRHTNTLANRGTTRRALGDLSGAVEDYGNALEAARPDWPHRAAAERLLAQARAALANRGR